jgi:hypothetical protein
MKPESYMAISTFTFLFCSWIFGALALFYSFQVGHDA